MPEYSIRIIIAHKSYNTFNLIYFLIIQVEVVKVIPNNIFTKRPPKKANKYPIVQYYRKNTSIKPEIKSRKASMVMPATTGKYLLKTVFGIFVQNLHKNRA